MAAIAGEVSPLSPPTRAPPSEVETVPQRPTEAADSGRATYRPMSGRAVGPLVFSEDEDEPERRLRWEPPPPDDWWTQWNRTRPEREWYYPAYRGPERFDYPRAPRASGVHRSGSGRDHGPRMSYRPTRYLQPPPPPSNARPSFERDTIPPGPIRGDPEENWDSEEELVTYETGKAGGKSGGRGPPRRPPPTETEGSMRLPFLGWLNTTVKGHFVATLGEFIGTTLFLVFAFSGTQVANVNSQSNLNTTTGQTTGFNVEVLLYIALAFGFSLMVNVWVFFRISGGLFNPAVTLGMVLVKAINVSRAILLVGAQITGGIFASFLVDVLFPTQFNVRTTLSPGTSLVRGVFIEALLTAELVFTIFMLAKEKHKATFIAPVGIGLALFIAELVGVFYTGGSLNPARSFGPCVVTGVWDQEHWIYWLGPAIGSVLAVLFYKFILVLEYEIANPGQDEQDPEEASKAAREIRAEKLQAAASRGSQV